MLISVAGSALCQDAGEPEAATLDSVRVNFHAAVKDAAKPLMQLLDQYAGRLEALRGQEEKAGNLEAVLEIKGEIADFRSGISREAEKSSALRQAQKIYRDAMTRRRGDFRQAVRPLLLSYGKVLAKLETDLTSSGKVEQAIVVRDEKQRMAELIAGDLSRVAIDLGVLPEGFDPSKQSRVTVIPASRTTNADVKVLKDRLPAATNRPYYYSGIPAEFEGFNVLRMEVRGNLTYRYVTTSKCRLFLLVHSDNVKSGSKPGEEGWKKLESTVVASGGFFHVFEKEHRIGEFELSTQGPWPYILMSKGEIEVKKE